MKSAIIYVKPINLAVITVLLYLALFLAVFLRTPLVYPQLQPPYERLFAFIHPGWHWDTNHARPVNLESIGYDGQFFYDLAINPLHPLTQLDNPPYRTDRMLYPLVVRFLAVAQPLLVPLAMVLVNFIAIVLSVYLLTLILKRLKQPAFLAIGYALWPGTVCAFLYDLSEPLCFLLVIAALWLFLVRPEATIRLGLLLLLASLTKELALLFGGGWLLYYFSRGEKWKILQLSLSWLLPYGVWQLLLRLWFGRDGLNAGKPFNWMPFGGFWNAQVYDPPLTESLGIFLVTVVPLFWLLKLWRNRASYKETDTCPDFSGLLFLVAGCQAAFLLFLPTASYIYLVDHARNATGLPLVLLLLPQAGFGRLKFYLLGTGLALSAFLTGVFLVTGNAFL